MAGCLTQESACWPSGAATAILDPTARAGVATPCVYHTEQRTPAAYLLQCRENPKAPCRRYLDRMVTDSPAVAPEAHGALATRPTSRPARRHEQDRPLRPATLKAPSATAVRKQRVLGGRQSRKKGERPTDAPAQCPRCPLEQAMERVVDQLAYAAPLNCSPSHGNASSSPDSP